MPCDSWGTLKTDSNYPRFTAKLPATVQEQLPPLITEAGSHASYHFVEVFTAGIANESALFRTATGCAQGLTDNRLTENDVLRMIKRRSKEVGLSANICCHTFRSAGITTYLYLENGGTIENAQQIAAHESPRTTKLYDRTQDQISLDEIERIVI